MKNGKEDTNMESSNENELSLGNRLQAEQDNLEKADGSAIEIESETALDVDNTGAAHDENNNSMAIEETSTDKTDNNTNDLGNTTTLVTNGTVPAGASGLPATTNVNILVTTLAGTR